MHLQTWPFSFRNSVPPQSFHQIPRSTVACDVIRAGTSPGHVTSTAKVKVKVKVKGGADSSSGQLPSSLTSTC